MAGFLNIDHLRKRSVSVGHLVGISGGIVTSMRFEEKPLLTIFVRTAVNHFSPMAILSVFIVVTAAILRIGLEGERMEKRFRDEAIYQLSLKQAQLLQESGLITEEEYRAFECFLKEKHCPFISQLSG